MSQQSGKLNALDIQWSDSHQEGLRHKVCGYSTCHRSPEAEGGDGTTPVPCLLCVTLCWSTLWSVLTLPFASSAWGSPNSDSELGRGDNIPLPTPSKALLSLYMRTSLQVILACAFLEPKGTASSGPSLEPPARTTKMYFVFDDFYRATVLSSHSPQITR